MIVSPVCRTVWPRGGAEDLLNLFHQSYQGSTWDAKSGTWGRRGGHEIEDVLWKWEKLISNRCYS